MSITVNHSYRSRDSLYNISLNKLYMSMNNDILEYIFKRNLSPSMFMDIIWKMLCINNENQEFINDYTLQYNNQFSIERGRKLVELIIPPYGVLVKNNAVTVNTQISSVYCETFSKNQQTSFNDNFQIIDRFTLSLFFKLVKATQQREQLFTLFQICIQHKGLDFPKQLAEEWLNTITHIEDVDIIEQGLELGIFLCDAGWYEESKHILSYTYKILCTKWEYLDQNLKLLKIVQCLAKWLRASSNYYDIEEARIVLEYLSDNIRVIENMEERDFYIAYACFAISNHYELLMEYNESWIWAVKAIKELQDENDNNLKLTVIGHAINIARKNKKVYVELDFMTELYTYSEVIPQSIYLDLLRNQVRRLLNGKVEYSIKKDLHCALDMSRNLYGYFNLQTGICFLNYVSLNDEKNLTSIDAMNCVFQAIFIMEKLKLPSNSMWVAKAKLMKSLRIKNYTDTVQSLPYIIRMSTENRIDLFKEMEVLQSDALDVSKKIIGNNTLYTANILITLGSEYQVHKKHSESILMFSKAMEIKKSILGNNNHEVGECLEFLGDLYKYNLKKYSEAEKCFLAAIAIYDNSFNTYYREMGHCVGNLMSIHRLTSNESDDAKQYLCKLMQCLDISTEFDNMVDKKFNRNHILGYINLKIFQNYSQ